jgi:hypothetical protein
MEEAGASRNPLVVLEWDSSSASIENGIVRLPRSAS